MGHYHSGIRELSEIGRIGRTHGLQGELRFLVHSGNFAFFIPFRSFVLEGVGVLEVVKIRETPQCLLVLFKGYEQVDKARELVGKKVSVYREELGLKEGEFLIEDYKGLRVYDTLKQREIGIIGGYYNVGEGLFEVKLDGGKTALIPCGERFWSNISLEKKTVELTDTLGLLDFAL